MEPFVHSAKSASLFLLSPWLEGEIPLTAGFSSRLDGVSDIPWKSFNLGLHVDDDKEDVVSNRKRLTELIDWSFDAWTCAEQVHQNKVHQVTALEKGKGRLSLDDTIAGCDAIMTDQPGILLTSLYADCVPLYFYEPGSGAIALAHAGWRGTVGEIAVHTIQAMMAAYNVNPANMHVAIGPSIGSCCYEVDGIVIDEVQKLLHKYQISQMDTGSCLQWTAEGKARMNLKEINRQIMIKAGILPIHIEISKWCTGCHTDLFYSHRVEAGRTGRMASWIGIQER